MRTVKTGHVERMIWWKGIETIDLLQLSEHFPGNEWNWRLYSETLEIAMLIVKRKEKVMRMKLSRLESRVNLKVPQSIKT